MKIRYLINDSETHYVEYEIDLKNKIASYKYLKDNKIVTNRLMSIASVLDVQPTTNPQVHLAKKGNLWDFHIFKVDVFGKEHRKSLGLYLEEDLMPTKALFVNDGTQDVTLKDYNTHKLDVYNSLLMIKDYTFDNLNHISGQSSITIPTPQLSPTNMLKLGFQSDILLHFAGEGELNINDVPTTFFVRFGTFGQNNISGQSQFVMELGANTIAIDLSKGVLFNNVIVLGASFVKNNMTLRIEATKTIVRLFVDNQVVTLNGFNVTQPLEYIRLKGFCNNGDFTLVDEFKVYAMENYRLDSIPPNPVQFVEATSGDQEIFLTWDANTEDDLAGYNVYVDGHRHNVAIIPTTDFQITGLVNGQAVGIVVTAIDKSGNESIPTKTITMQAISDPAKEVSNVSSYVTNNGVFLRWDNPTHPDYNGIKLYRINIKTNQRTELATLGKTITTFQDTPRPNAGEYDYILAAVDVYGHETDGVTLRRHIAPSIIEHPINETLEFMIPVSALAHRITISVNPTWTFTRENLASTTFKVRYENAKTGDDILLPDVQLINPDGYGGGTLVFKNQQFSLSDESSYNFELQHLDLSGDLIDTDTVSVVVTPPNYDVEKISGLTVVADTGITFNALHLVTPTVKHYHVYMDGQELAIFPTSQIVVNGSLVEIDLVAGYNVDWTIDHVFSVTASTDGTNATEFGQEEVAYIAP